MVYTAGAVKDDRTRKQTVWDGMGYTVGTGVATAQKFAQRPTATTATNRINNYVLSKGRRPYYGVYSRCSQR